MWLKCTVTYLFVFILDLHTTKTLTLPYCATFGCKYDSAKYRVVFFHFLWKNKTLVKQWFHNCGQAGWKRRDMLDFVWPILKSRVLKFIYFHQLMENVKA